VTEKGRRAMEPMVALLVTAVVLPMIILKARDLFVFSSAHERQVNVRPKIVIATPNMKLNLERKNLTEEELRKLLKKVEETPELDREELVTAAETSKERDAAPPSPLEKLVDRFETRLAVQVVITLVGVIGGGYIILSGNYSEGMETTSGGIIGMVFGYWLK
jgi:hypothetical protein